MKTNFAYIDDVMDRAIDAEHAAPEIPEKDKADASKKAKKLIGGFRVHDHDAERKALDDLIATRRAGINKFKQDRAEVRERLANKGVTALAVCPTGAWYKICRDAGLFVLTPDGQNRVRFDREAFKMFTGRSAERDAEKYAENHWPKLLNLMFPNGVSPAVSSARATLVLPDPPADVAEILCKVQSMDLTVAAVPDAIRFAEPTRDLMKAAHTSPKDLWAQEQGYEDYADWVKRDPIIFTEHESAVAIIAQFGEFPIEQAVVDAAVKSDNLLTAKPGAIDINEYTTTSLDDLYRRTLMQAAGSQWGVSPAAIDAMRRQQALYEAEASRARSLANSPNRYLIGDWGGL